MYNKVLVPVSCPTAGEIKRVSDGENFKQDSYTRGLTRISVPRRQKSLSSYGAKVLALSTVYP
jgi:hypothetical protein